LMMDRLLITRKKIEKMRFVISRYCGEKMRGRRDYSGLHKKISWCPREKKSGKLRCWNITGGGGTMDQNVHFKREKGHLRVQLPLWDHC